MRGKAKERAPRGHRGGGGSARGYEPGGIYLRRGSRAAEALETLRLETVRTGHALTATAWRAAHEQRIAATAVGFDTTVFSLRRRGLVIVVGGRTRSLQYVVAAAPVPAAPTIDPYEVLDEVVTRSCAAMQHAVGLATIGAGMASRGISLSSDQLSTMLAALVTTSEARAVASQVAARLECVYAKGEMWGRERRFWRPVGTEFPAPASQLISRSAALIVAALETESALGRAAAPVEIRAWAVAHADHPAARMSVASGGGRTRFAAALRTLVKQESSRPKPRLCNRSTALTSDGGVPLRVGSAGAPAIAVATAHVTDVCYAFRPSTELAACARLTELGLEDGVAALSNLAEVRRRMLGVGMRTHLAALGDPGALPWVEIQARATAAAETLRLWWEGSRRRPSQRLPRWVADAEDAARAVPVIRDAIAGSLEGTNDVAVVGENGLRPMSDAIAWLREVLVPQGRSFGTPQPHLLGVRRFDNPRWERDRLYSGEREAFSLLDVGDVLQAVSELTECGTIRVLLRCAASLLGSVVRDASVLRQTLTALPHEATMYRHAAVIALGALGDTVAPEETVDYEGDCGGLDAFALAVAVAPVTACDRAELLEAARERISASLRYRLDTMIERAASGYALSLVM